jgi:FxsC-like protein
MSSGQEYSPPNQPYFFLSYARTPRYDPSDRNDPDRWVHRFYRDVCQNILALKNVPPASAGFMDRENRVGDIWPDELARALASCRVFVPLYSERYFASVHCGREWYAFRRRELSQWNGQTGSAILPVLWTGMDERDFPPATSGLQYKHPSFGAHYAEDGLYGIMKLDRYRREYQRLVFQFAKLIIEVADETRLRPGEPADYASLDTSFGGPVNPAPAHAGLQITVLALDSGSVPGGRSPDYYGETPRTWRPYWPEHPLPVAESAAGLAQCCGYRPAVGTFDEHERGWARNGRPVPPGVCLIDPWAALSGAHQDRLGRLDRLDRWVSVIVPWNQGDTETARAEPALRQALAGVLGRKLADVPRRCRLAADGVPTMREFDALLPEMAGAMLKRFLADPSVPAFPPGPPLERPRLRPVEDPSE